MRARRDRNAGPATPTDPNACHTPLPPPPTANHTGINIYEDLEGAATDWGAQLYEDCGKKLGDIVAMLM